MRRRWTTAHLARLVACGALLLGACGDDGDEDSAVDEEDPIAAAEAQVARAEERLTEAQSAFDEASTAFCSDSADYIESVDRYGGVFNDDEATVGDVTEAGADLQRPREAVTSSADDVLAARDDVAEAEEDLAEAQAALAAAQTGTTVAEEEASTTTTEPLVPAATVERVEQAEEDLASAFEGVTEETPLSEATAEVNAAAFALQVSWLRLFADASCLTDEQQQQGVAALTDYTAALQTSLTIAGYYEGAIDGVYGPETVDAVERLQTDNGLPVTGFVDRATATALEEAVLAVQGVAESQAIAHTAALQSFLTLAGYWTGPLDGQWTDELTAALQAFQTDAEIEPTGVLDPPTLAAIQQAIAEASTPPTTTSTTEASTSTTGESTTTTAA
jgi:peptidoglycan hydrolase-like protein with peptidoglycan-binding domain